MGFKPCPHCDDGEAEALYAVDGMIEWHCPECQASWTEEPVHYEAITSFDKWWEEQMR